MRGASFEHVMGAGSGRRNSISAKDNFLRGLGDTRLPFHPTSRCKNISYFFPEAAPGGVFGSKKAPLNRQLNLNLVAFRSSFPPCHLPMHKPNPRTAKAIRTGASALQRLQLESKT